MLGREARDLLLLYIANELIRARASALLKYNRGRFIYFLYQGRSSLYCCAVYSCGIAVWLQFPVLNLVFQYDCSGARGSAVLPFPSGL